MPVNDNCDTKDKSERVEKQYITKSLRVIWYFVYR